MILTLAGPVAKIMGREDDRACRLFVAEAQREARKRWDKNEFFVIPVPEKVGRRPGVPHSVSRGS
jgi:hypothetical protein